MEDISWGAVLLRNAQGAVDGLSVNGSTHYHMLSLDVCPAKYRMARLAAAIHLAQAGIGILLAEYERLQKEEAK